MREVPKRRREEVGRVREKVVKVQARDKKRFTGDHNFNTGDEQILRDGGDRFRPGEVQEEIFGEGNLRNQVFRDQDRKHGDGKRHFKDSRLSRELGNGIKSDRRGEDGITKFRTNRHFQLHRLSTNIDRTHSRKEVFFKGNVDKGHSVAHVHRQNIRGVACGSDEFRWGDHQDVLRDAHRIGRKVDNDNSFARIQRRIDIVDGKGRSTQKPKDKDEEPHLLRQNSDGQKYHKENGDYSSREMKGMDQPRRKEIKRSRHEVSSQAGKSQGMEGGSMRRCSSKVVAPSHLIEQDVGGSIDQHGGKDKNAWEERARETFPCQENSKMENRSKLQHYETVKSFIKREPRGTIGGTRQALVEIDDGPDVAGKNVLHQITSNRLSPCTLKYADKRKGRNQIKVTESNEKPSVKSDHTKEKQCKDDSNRKGGAKRKALLAERDGQEGTTTEDMATRKSVEAPQIKPAKVTKIKEKSSELLSRRQLVKINRDKYDEPSHEHKRQKHNGSAHSVSPRTKKCFLSPKVHGKSTSPGRTEKDRTDWENFERERHNTLAAFDSRYRRFGGGTSGLGGYSPRRRRSEAAVKTPSPPPRSPERRKPQTWDSAPPGMDPSMIAVISAAHHVAVQHAFVTMATGPPVVPSSILISPGGTPSVSNRLASLPSMIPSLPQQVNASVTAVTLTQATRPLRRLYVGNVPSTVSDGELLEFMNAAMLSANANHLPGTKPCINCSVNVEKSHAFAEFITPEDATAALAFDGVTLHGTTLKIRRPKDFVPPSNGGMESASAVLDMVSSIVADSPCKVFVGGIASSITADKVKEIVTAFGQLKAYHWEVDYKMQPPQPFAFLEYMDPTVTLNACAGLNGMRLGTGCLTVVQATPDADPEITSTRAPFYGIPEHVKTLLEPPSCVLELHNLISAEEVLNLSKEDAEELMEDVHFECSRFGNVKSTHMEQRWSHPDPEIKNTWSPGKGEVIAVKIGGGANSGNGSVSCVEQEEVAKEEEPTEQTETMDEMSRSPAGRLITCSFKEDEEQQVCEVNNRNNEKIVGPMNESRTVDAGVSISHPASGELSDEQQPVPSTSLSEKAIPPDRSELLHVPEKDICKHLGSSSDCAKEVHVYKSESQALHAGKVYVEFSRNESACQAAHCLHGRQFGSNRVAVCYFPLKLYQKKFQKGLGPRTFLERQALALAVQGHLTAHIKD